MKYMKTLLCVLSIAALFTTSVVGAEPSEPWRLTLAGSGTTAVTDKATTLGVELGVGHSAGTVVLPLELGVRQSLSYSSSPNWVLGTRTYADWTLLTVGKNFELQGGLNAGATYGNTSFSWVAGPEVVAKLYLKKDVYAYTRVQYDFELNNRNAISQTAADKVRIAVGIGLNF